MQNTKEMDYQDLLMDCKRLTESKIANTKENEREFIDLFAFNCYQSDIPIHPAVCLAAEISPLFINNIIFSFESAYGMRKVESAKSANSAKQQSDVQKQAVEDFLKNTPYISDELYSQMPKIIKDGAMAFNDFRERDVFLTGSLAILSGCLRGVRGMYDGQEVYPNLFSFAIAPAASGKGALKFAKMLADAYHNDVLKTSRDLETKYNQELSDFKQKISNKRKKDQPTEEIPNKPPFKVVYIPANTSHAKILWHLDQNKGSGIICETEADTLSNVFKQEWGSYSDLLRKTFHNERTSSSKKLNNEFIEIDCPHLSVALSGTPNQVAGLISSAEDGLFSRFLFYVFKVEQKWRDVSPSSNKINLTEHFKNLSTEVFNFVTFLKLQKTEICLTPEQWIKLNKQCEDWLNDITTFTSEEAASIVKRLGLIMYRIVMLFTALRKFENGELTSQMTSTDQDFNTALQLIEVYQQHSILMFNNLPKQGVSTQFKKGDGKQKFIDALPEEFTTKQAVEIGKKFDLSYSTVTHYLPKQVPKLFSQPKAGHYKKNQI